MNESRNPNFSVDSLTILADLLDAGFGRPQAGPRSTLEAAQRPLLLKEAEGESAHIIKPKSDAMPAPEQIGDRYQLQGEIARGGMGAVLRGRDVDLGRELAVKVLLEKFVHRPVVARRFIDEAQIGGQLQHPGVVPVYDIGHFGDRPFFTMKLVKGHTLAQMLGKREKSTHDRPRLLSIVLKVAEALAYAHAKGVIHRDLKPANIMVGAFGEVQVMDWGLAKVLKEGGIADEEFQSRERERLEDGVSIRTARGSGKAGKHGTDTQAGSLLGTPAYMPPEQANGDIANLDRRADVFGLGAILCEILTGKPPYVGPSDEVVRLKASNGDLTDATARLDGCGADAELIALTKACLSPKAADRLADAQEVSDGLSAYLNGVQERLQAAERERAVAVVRAGEERKRRRVQLVLAAAVVLMLLGGGAFAWWRNEQIQLVRQRDARNAEAVAAMLDRGEEALRAGDAAKAAVALEAARKRFAEGGAEELAERLGRLDADLVLLRDLDAIDQFRWTMAENVLPEPKVVATRTRAALARFGAVPDAVSVDQATARVSVSAVRERIVTALDRLLQQEKTAGVRGLLQRVDADSYRDAIRDAFLTDDRAKVVELTGQKAALEQPPGFVAILGEDAAIGMERRQQLLETAVIRRPQDLVLLMALGTIYPHKPAERVGERLRWFQAAVAVAPDNVAALLDLGLMLSYVGQMEKAIACYKKAIALDPKLAMPHNNLGVALAKKGRLDEAISCFTKTIALDPKLTMAYGNLGAALSGKGRQDEANGFFTKAVALDPESAPAHYNLGNALRSEGKWDDALASYRKATELDPKYAEAHCNLGLALEQKGRFAESLTEYKRGHELGTKKPDWRYPSAEWVRQAEEKAAIEARLPAFLKGQFQPQDNPQRLTLTNVCQAKKLYRAAATLYAAVFAADPKLADDLQAGHRYNAACSAALAAAGHSEYAAKLDDRERARLRKQALDWLRADLILRIKQLKSDKPADRTPAQQALRHWQNDADLAGVREKAALTKLPAAEQKAFAQLWTDVAAALHTK